jgi:hypothetical protein
MVTLPRDNDAQAMVDNATSALAGRGSRMAPGKKPTGGRPEAITRRLQKMNK